MTDVRDDVFEDAREELDAIGFRASTYWHNPLDPTPGVSLRQAKMDAEFLGHLVHRMRYAGRDKPPFLCWIGKYGPPIRDAYGRRIKGYPEEGTLVWAPTLFGHAVQQVHHDANGYHVGEKVIGILELDEEGRCVMQCYLNLDAIKKLELFSGPKKEATE